MASHAPDWRAGPVVDRDLSGSRSSPRACWAMAATASRRAPTVCEFAALLRFFLRVCSALAVPVEWTVPVSFPLKAAHNYAVVHDRTGLRSALPACLEPVEWTVRAPVAWTVAGNCALGCVPMELHFVPHAYRVALLSPVVDWRHHAPAQWFGLLPFSRVAPAASPFPATVCCAPRRVSAAA